MLTITNPAHYFYLNNGIVLRDAYELLEALNNISSETFSHHVNAEKNDFYNWTKEVLNDNLLAKRLLTAKSQSEMALAVEKRLNSISKMKTKKETKKSMINKIKEACAHE